VIAKLEPGGAQIAAFRLSAGLRRHAIESHLIAGDATAEGVRLAREYDLEAECLHERVTGLQWTPSAEFAAWLAPRLRGADLVHAHMFGAWWAAAQVVPDGVPLVASEHNAYKWPGEPCDRELRAALPRVDRFFAHSPKAAATLREAGLPAERLARGRSSVDGPCPPLPGLPSPRIVFTGRLARDKGPDLLVEALARMDRPAPAFFVGEGCLRESLERRATELGLDGRVTFTGWQRSPGRYVAGASVFAAPSREEAWSQSVVHAMLLGTPVVGAAVEGLPAVLGDGRGILVPPEDPAALARAIAEVLAGRRPDLEAARAYARCFDPESVAELYAAAYRELVSRARRGSAGRSCSAGTGTRRRAW
jgi:glycosyltransferase involved in cell wall biosynthesis